MMKNDSFVYCWTDHKTQKLYVGVHKGNINDGYISSSKTMMEEYTIRPNDFARQIIANGTFADCFSLETKILQATNACQDKKFYNGHNNNGKFYITEHRSSTKEKFKKAWEKLDRRDEFSKRMKTDNPMKNSNFLHQMLITRKINKEEKKKEIIRILIDQFLKRKENKQYNPKEKYRRNGRHLHETALFVEWFKSNNKSLIHRLFGKKELLEALNNETSK